MSILIVLVFASKIDMFDIFIFKGKKILPALVGY